MRYDINLEEINEKLPLILEEISEQDRLVIHYQKQENNRLIQMELRMRVDWNTVKQDE